MFSKHVKNHKLGVIPIPSDIAFDMQKQHIGEWEPSQYVQSLYMNQNQKELGFWVMWED